MYWHVQNRGHYDACRWKHIKRDGRFCFKKWQFYCTLIDIAWWNMFNLLQKKAWNISVFQKQLLPQRREFLLKRNHHRNALACCKPISRRDASSSRMLVARDRRRCCTELTSHIYTYCCICGFREVVNVASPDCSRWTRRAVSPLPFPSLTLWTSTISFWLGCFKMAMVKLENNRQVRSMRENRYAWKCSLTKGDLEM